MHIKLLTTIWLFFFLILFLPFPIRATNNPTGVANNKFGIHVTNEADIEKSAELVNSSGGDWGYVTLVIREDERDSKRWQEFFDKLREKHLIPIVRLASKQSENGWQKPNIDEIDGWVGFLNSLNWVVANRYVIIGNEVNLGKEWGGKADPDEYANYLDTIAERLKKESFHYFVMAAALDSNAKSNSTDVEEAEYMIQMLSGNRDRFRNLDGLASHSYPYKELGQENLKGTLKHYEWELNLIKSLGIEKSLPVFITETGWMHGDEYLSQHAISEKMAYALNNVWNDSRIAAVTPFVLNYNTHPFEHYSWIASDGRPFGFYNVYKNHPKIEGGPVRVQEGEVVSYLLPRFIRTRFNNIYGLMYIKNTGQTIWKGNYPLTLSINGTNTQVKPITIMSDVKPEQKALAVYSIKNN